MSTTQDPPDIDALFCPNCAYDLRHNTSDRCPECGHAFDRATLHVSRIAWPHRRELGRVTAWWRTVRTVVGNAQLLSQEITRPVSWADATQFRWVTLIVAAVLSTLGAATLYPFVNLESFQVNRNFYFWASDPLYPLKAPLTGPWLVPTIGLTTFLGGAAAIGWMRAWFWLRGGRQGAAARDRAATLSCYLSAWAIPVVLALLLNGAVAALLSRIEIGDSQITTIAGFLWLINLSVLVLGTIALVRVFHGTTRRGDWEMALTAVMVPLGAAVALAIAACVTDYAVGLLAIMIRSLMQ